jgi:alkaline phosphatase
VIGEVFDFAAKDGETLVIITADHETGGFSINGGSTETGEVKGAYTTGGHTGVMIPVLAFGPGAEAFSGFYENTAIFDKMMNALKLKR